MSGKFRNHYIAVSVIPIQEVSWPPGEDLVDAWETGALTEETSAFPTVIGVNFTNRVIDCSIAFTHFSIRKFDSFSTIWKNWDTIRKKSRFISASSSNLFSRGHATLELAVSVGLLVRHVTFLIRERFRHYCPCPTVRDWGAVYPALFLLYSILYFIL